MDVLKAEIERKRKLLEDKKLVVCTKKNERKLSLEHSIISNTLIYFLSSSDITLKIIHTTVNHQKYEKKTNQNRMTRRNFFDVVIYWHKKKKRTWNSMAKKMKMHRHLRKAPIHVSIN